MMIKKPAAVLWDMDGTIIDTEPAWLAAEKQLLARFGARVTEADTLAWVGIGLWDLAQIFQDRGVTMQLDEIVATLTAMVDEQIFAGRLAWRPGAQELIAGFKKLGIPNALVTMATRGQATRIISLLPAGSFVSVTGGDDVARPKPHPDPYLQGAGSLGVDPRHCIAIEDSVTGVKSAAAAGTFVVAVPNLIDLSGSPFDVLVDSLADVNAAQIIQMFQNRKLNT